MKAECGILMFAHNNLEIDYFRLAVVNSLLIKKNLGQHNITVVTDQYSYDYAISTLGEDLVNHAISNVILVEKDPEYKSRNIRTYKDTSHNAKPLPFYNLNRADAYDISPYQQTLLIDVDFLVLSDMLNQCWSHNNELMMSYEYQDVMSERCMPGLDRLNGLGIPLYWATVVYFRKTDLARSFFTAAKHVQQNPEFYKDLYRWKGNLFRNDHSFSIAAHMVSGFSEKGIPQLPFKLYKTFDTDDVLRANSAKSLTLLLEKPRSPGDFIITNWQDLDIHVMNKWAINRVSEVLLEYAR
jgi:hypothetical protein